MFTFGLGSGGEVTYQLFEQLEVEVLADLEVELEEDVEVVLEAEHEVELEDNEIEVEVCT